MTAILSQTVGQIEVFVRGGVGCQMVRAPNQQGGVAEALTAL